MWTETFWAVPPDGVTLIVPSLAPSANEYVVLVSVNLGFVGTALPFNVDNVNVDIVAVVNEADVAVKTLPATFIVVSSKPVCPVVEFELLTPLK